MKHDSAFEQMPVVANLQEFDRNSGSLLERLLFNNRWAVIILCVVATIVLGFQATKLRLNASFERMIPTQHPYIVNYFQHKADLVGLGNSIAIAVETPDGTIFDPAYLETLRTNQ